MAIDFIGFFFQLPMMPHAFGCFIGRETTTKTSNCSFFLKEKNKKKKNKQKRNCREQFRCDWIVSTVNCSWVTWRHAAVGFWCGVSGGFTGWCVRIDRYFSRRTIAPHYVSAVIHSVLLFLTTGEVASTSESTLLPATWIITWEWN